jgi:hypothetical protein
MRSESSSVRSKVICTFVVILGCLLFTQARSQEAGKAVADAEGHARFESASVAVAAGSNCIIHPAGNQDPRESLHANADEDGVVRFLAVRPRAPNSVERLVLECTDANKQAKTYSIDLRSDDTFKPRPFDPSHTTLRVRPALTDDPSRFTKEELLKEGYGLRPDATENPDAYQKWLSAASVPMHILRTDRTLTPFPISRQRDLKRSERGPTLRDRNVVQKFPSNFWTGPVLIGSFQKKATAAETISYGAAYTTIFTPSLFAGRTAASTIWVGLDNVFQTIIDVNTTPTTATFGIHRQDFSPHGNESDEAGTRFTPAPGEMMIINVWYCDAGGNEKLDGGYACSFMLDANQGVIWECDHANSSDCPSYKLDQQDLGNGKLGFQAEFIIENDTSQVVSGSEEWPVFSQVTMVNSLAGIVKGNSQVRPPVGPGTDPLVQLNTDDSKSTRHLRITVEPFGTTWDEIECSAEEQWDGNREKCVRKN